LNELIITVENVNPVIIWGANNEYFEIIKKSFPKIKIVARGNDVKVLGDEIEINNFNLKFDEILKHIDQFQSLNINDLEKILGTNISISS
jgi:phosphate starvation-inducible PhoH-like protein